MQSGSRQKPAAHVPPCRAWRGSLSYRSAAALPCSRSLIAQHAQDQATLHAIAVPREQQGDDCGNLAASGHSWPCSLRDRAQGLQSSTSPGAGRRPERAPDPQSIMPAAHSYTHARMPYRAGAPQLNARHKGESIRKTKVRS